MQVKFILYNIKHHHIQKREIQLLVAFQQNFVGQLIKGFFYETYILLIETLSKNTTSLLKKP